MDPDRPGGAAREHATRVRRRVQAPRAKVYRALRDADPALQGEMTIAFTLSGAGSGTEVVAAHEGLPPGLSLADNETGWRGGLAKLAAFVEMP